LAVSSDMVRSPSGLRVPWAARTSVTEPPPESGSRAAPLPECGCRERPGRASPRPLVPASEPVTARLPASEMRVPWTAESPFPLVSAGEAVAAFDHGFDDAGGAEGAAQAGDGHFDGVLGRVPGGAAGQDGAQVGAGDDVAGLVGEAFEHGHGGGRQGPEFAVDGDGVAADLQVVAAG